MPLRTHVSDLQTGFCNQAPRVYDVFENCLCVEQVLGKPPAERSAAEALNLTERVETLFALELEATRDLHAELSARSGLDSAAAWVQTTVTKRVVYVTFPMILRDPLAATWFPRVGVNNRVRLFPADPIERSVRLEAISTFARTDSRFRYALSIQYVRDLSGLSWQVIRPVILIDPWIIDTLAALGERASDTLIESLRLLGLMVSQGSHDYLHGTMMRWFLPPAIDCPAEYRRLMVERPAPPEMQHWEACAVGRVSGPVSRDDAIPISDPLEYWSLAVHAESVARMVDREPVRLDALHELHGRYCRLLVDLVRVSPTPDVRASAEMLCAVSAFFLALISPRADQTPTTVEGAASVLDWSVVDAFVAGAHHGLAGVVSTLDRSQFVWAGVRMDIHDVLRIYMRDMERLYERLTRSQARNGHGDGVRYGLYEELARKHRVA
jgi:hypothetical protein